MNKYVKEVKKYAKKENKDFKSVFFYVLRPDYNNEDYSKLTDGNKYIEIKYSDIYEIIEKRNGKSYFQEFKEVVAKHSKEYNNELFETMNERFISQIKQK